MRIYAFIVSDVGRRHSMEDAHFLVRRKIGVCGGVLDGHGGSYAAEYSAENLPKRFFAALRTCPPEEAFTRSYEEVSAGINEWETHNGGVGACAAAFFVDRGSRTIYFANAGDVRILVVRNNRSFQQLSRDHRIDDEMERCRVEEAGATIDYPYLYRGEEGLMPTRALGDRWFKSVGVIATPWTGRYELGEGSRCWLVIGCDGLFDFVSNEEVAQVVSAQAVPRKIATALKEKALVEREGRDNLTVMVLKLWY